MHLDIHAITRAIVGAVCLVASLCIYAQFGTQALALALPLAITGLLGILVPFVRRSGKRSACIFMHAARALCAVLFICLSLFLPVTTSMTGFGNAPLWFVAFMQGAATLFLPDALLHGYTPIDYLPTLGGLCIILAAYAAAVLSIIGSSMALAEAYRGRGTRSEDLQ